MQLERFYNLSWKKPPHLYYLQNAKKIDVGEYKMLQMSGCTLKIASFK